MFEKFEVNEEKIFMISYILILIISLLYIIYSNKNYNLKAIYMSLVLGLISLLGVILNFKNNEKLQKQNNKLFEQNIETRYLELRFKESKSALFELNGFLKNTLYIYEKLKNLYNTNWEFKELYIPPYVFLVMQLTKINSNSLLLKNLPLYIQKEFDVILKNEYVSNGINSKEDIALEYIIRPREPILKLDFFPIYLNFINEFKSDLDEIQKQKFKEYYLNISEKDLEQKFRNIFEEINNNTIEEIILKDKPKNI